MKAVTVAEYLANLPSDRRAELEQVRSAVLRNLPAGYQEILNGGLIAYVIPLERFPDTYNGQPLYYAALGAHKNYHTLYLMGAYGHPGQRKELEDAFKQSGKKMDMGKSCLHFQAANDLPLDAIGRLIAAISSEKWLEMYQKSREGTKKGAAKKTTRRKVKPHSRP